MRRPRVLHIGKFYPPHKGGIETHLQQLCRAIANDFDVAVVVSSSTTEEILENDGRTQVHRVAKLGMLASAPICPRMASAIRSTPADIVHLHSPNPTAVLSYFASGHPGKLVVTHHSDIVRQRLLKLGYEPFLRRLMSRAERIVCFSPNYMESSPILSIHREKCRVVPHGIDVSAFQKSDPAAISEIRRKFGNRIVLGVGRLVYYKGFDILIHAISQTDATLLIIGTGPLLSKLQRLARECGVVDRVHFLGEVHDPVPYYRAARLFTLPATARSEAFGIVQLEAMACGTPVINTRIDSGVPFVSVHDVSGLSVPPSNVDALRSAIDSLLNDDQLRRRLSEGAVSRVCKHFTVDRMAADTIGLYEQVLANTSQPIAIGAKV